MCQSEINKFNGAISDHDVLKLDVGVYYFESMQVGEGEQQLPDNLDDLFLFEDSELLLEVEE